MLRLRDNSVKKPELYPVVERKSPTISDKGWDKVGGYTLRDKVDLMPQPGLQEKMCACDSNLIFICGDATVGKAQPYDALVLTPKGFVRMGDIKAGDTITGTDGKPQTVLQVFEQGVRKVCRLVFADGGKVECDYEHLWRVRATIKRGNAKNVTLTTNDIITALSKKERKYGDYVNFYTPLPKPIEYQYDVNLPIHPYVLGAIIGDGCTRVAEAKLRIYTPDTDIIDRIVSLGYPLEKMNTDPCGYTFPDIYAKDNLKKMGLWNCLSYDKFIPEDYLFASVDDRFELLHGLMDTDGSASGHSSAEYSTSSEKLAKQVKQLVLSLGGYCVLHLRIPHYTYKGEKKEGHQSYRLFISFANQQNAFELKRKKEKCRNVRNPHYSNGRRIVGYEYIGEKPCRCILVSNADHLYITDDFIVTHNTYSMFLKALQGIDKPGYTARMISVRLQDSKRGSSIFRDAMEVCGSFAECGYNSSDYPTFVWEKWNSSLQLIHANFNADNPQEWDKFRDYIKKQQSSYIAIDEATEIKQFKMFSYMFSRNRDSSGMTPCMVLSFNPEHGHFTTQILKDGGYIGNDWYLKPEMIGKTRYFYIKGDTPESIIWGDTPESVAKSARIVITKKEREAGVTIREVVKSFTVFTGEAADNLKLVSATKGQSIGNLHAVGGTQRSVLKGAYFGPIDNEDLTISRSMIHAFWENPREDDEETYATLDVSGGGTESDDCPMVIWKGLTIIALKFFRGDPKELVEWIDNILTEYAVPVRNFAFDATGIGYYLRGFSGGMPITANKRAMQEIDQYGNPVTIEPYFNLRSQLLGKTKVLIETGRISCAVEKDKLIPYGKKGMTRKFIDVLFDEMNVFITTTRNRKIYYRHKDEYKIKFKSSPNLMDSISLRAVFELDARPKKKPPVVIEENAYEGLYESYAGMEQEIWV